MGLFRPERYVTRVSAVNVQRDLLDRGITCVLLDIDNTIRSRADGKVPGDVAAWLQHAQEMGIVCLMLSNNVHSNVYDLSSEIGLPVVGKALKPLPFGYWRAMAKARSSAKNTVIVGDQVWTDILGGWLVGIHTILVDPLAEEDLAYTRIVRRVVSLLMGKMIPEDAEGEDLHG